MNCVVCDSPIGPSGFLLQAHGWLCGPVCYEAYCKQREADRAKEVWGDEATV